MPHKFTEAPPAGIATRNGPTKPGPKTVIVVGLPHGGTSVVAAVLQAMGVYMGPENDLRSGGGFEWKAFNSGSTQTWEPAIAEANAEHETWGWKNPHGVAMVDALPASVRNPHLVFVFRGLVAMLPRYGFIMRGQSTEAILKHLKQEADSLYDRLIKTEHPAIICSYERIKTGPESFVRDLAKFLHLALTADQWADAIGRVSIRGGYLLMPPEFGPGPGNEPSG